MTRNDPRPRRTGKKGKDREAGAERAREPIGDLRATDLTSEEAQELAADIEAERDA
jgi:hypothetical protein